MPERVTPVDGTLLQNGRGVDHLVIAVKNLDFSTKDFGEVLGFAMMPGGKHPTGTENATASFEDETYLELLSLYDPSKDEALSGFLEKHEGGISVGLHTSSAERSAAFLRAQGVEAKVGEGTIKFDEMADPSPVFWRWIEIREGTPASDTIFLIEYTAARMAYRSEHPEHYGKTSHPNTSRRLASVWIAVKDTDEAIKRYGRIGLPPTIRLDFPQMNARGVMLRASHGSILLLSPIESKGPILRFLMQRGEGVVGTSIEVNDLDACGAVLRQSGISPVKYSGIYGESIIVGPGNCHGLSMEFFQTQSRVKSRDAL